MNVTSSKNRKVERRERGEEEREECASPLPLWGTTPPPFPEHVASPCVARTPAQPVKRADMPTKSGVP